jgi:hypothetical protein
MPDISLSADQRERLQRVQERLDEDVAYGHVRPRDALEYLLDRFEADESPDATASVSTEDGSEFEVRNAGTPSAGARASVVTDDTDADADDTDTDTDADTDADASERREAEHESTDAQGADATDESGETRLNSVMSLLDDHAEVWREADGGEAKYEVDLPDGGTERARTKDDVRAVLFEHYR